MVLSDADRDALADAVRRLERPGLAGRLVALSGRPLADLERALPEGAAAVIAKAAAAALERALGVALFSLEDARLGRALRGRRAHSAWRRWRSNCRSRRRSYCARSPPSRASTARISAIPAPPLHALRSSLSARRPRGRRRRKAGSARADISRSARCWPARLPGWPMASSIAARCAKERPISPGFWRGWPGVSASPYRKS